MDLVTTPLRRLVDGESALRRWLWASLVCNMGIIVTGAVVRVTGSGLGCPTWPKCTDASYTPHGELGWHGLIEFGNRTLTFVLIAVALGAFFSAWVNRGRGAKLWWLTLGIGIGIPFQGVIGGLTVLSKLNPWVVAGHLLLSVALVVLCVWALLLGRRDEPTAVGRRTRTLVVVTFCVAMLAIWLGTVVTGAGPHAGDLKAKRNNLDILLVARIHSASAWVLTALSVASVWALRRARAVLPTRAAWTLLGTVAIQGLIGYIQYFTGLPVGVVILHLVGLTLVTAAASWLLFSTSEEALPRADRSPAASESVASR